MKKSVFRFLVTVATVAAVGFAVAGCNNGNDSGGNNSNGGNNNENNNGNNNQSGTASEFTLTDIPAEYEGKFAFFKAGGNPNLMGYLTLLDSDTGSYSLPKITGGKVVIPVWHWEAKEKYTGNDTYSHVYVGIFEDSIFEQGTTSALVHLNFEKVITFTNGSATVKYTDKQ